MTVAKLTKTSQKNQPSDGLVLELQNVSKSFGGLKVLEDVSFNLAEGETLVLTGPSGIGKSTLLRLIAGLDRAYTGKISIIGALAMVFQEPTLLPWISVVKNMTIATGADDKLTLAALRSVGLESKANAYPNDLSLGQQRRLSLARAFLKKPDVLLMDEPFVSLDSELSDEMMSVYEQLRQDTGVATILVTHSEREAQRLGDRILTLTGQPATLT